jgi:hypothetical protein
MTHEETAKLFGFKNPGPATIVKDVKTKMGLAFKKGEEVTVYESLIRDLISERWATRPTAPSPVSLRLFCRAISRN